MKIKKKNTTIPINGKIVDTENVEDKTSNAPSMRLVEEMTKDIYSTAEQAIGTWIDGKTIYRKVYHIDTVAGTTQYQLDTNSNIDFITRYSGSIYNPSTGSLYALGSVHSENTSHNYKQLYLNKNEQVLRMDIGDWQTTDGWKLYIILEYTKTTD